MFVCFPSLSGVGGGLSDICTIVGIFGFLGLRFSFEYFLPFCRAGFMDTYCLNLFLSWNVLFSPSMVKENFAGFSSLD